MPIESTRNRKPPMMREGVGGGGGIKAVKSTLSPTSKFRSIDLYSDKDYQISGYTKDSNGAILPNCTLELFYTNNDVLAGKTMSDANGFYRFRISPFYQCYVVAYLAGSPDVAGTTVNTLIAT